MSKKTKPFQNVLRIFAAAIVLTVALASFGVDSEAASLKKVSVSNLPANTLTLKKGKSKVLKVKVEKSGKVSKAVTWKSSKPSVVKVTQKGKVTAKKKGTAKVTVTSKVNKKKKATIKVTVGKPVTKVKLNATSAELYEGASTVLKTTVSPSKASNKKIVWTSSNTKVAKVSKSGKVTAVAAGTAKITATAADGSGKKAVCKVTVKKPVTIAAVEFKNGYTVSVTLSEAQALTKDNFSVMTKAHANGTYNRSVGIRKVTTSDNIHYVLTLTDSASYYIQVTVTGLIGTGTASVETEYNAGTYNYTYEDVRIDRVGEKVNFEESISGVAQSVTGTLPTGISYTIKSGDVRFSGTTQAAGDYTITISASDDVGNTYTKTLRWIVYDSDHFYAYTYDMQDYITIPAGKTETTYSAYIYTCGGVTPAADYDYTDYEYAVVDAGGLQDAKVNENGRFTATCKAAGDYTVKVQAVLKYMKDAEDGGNDTEVARCTAETSFTVHAAQVRTISGTVKGSNGTAVQTYDTANYKSIASVEVIFDLQDPTSKYSYDYEYDYIDSDGKYSVYLIDGTYDVTVSYYDYDTGEYTYEVYTGVQVSGDKADLDIIFDK